MDVFNVYVNGAFETTICAGAGTIARMQNKRVQAVMDDVEGYPSFKRWLETLHKNDVITFTFLE